MLKFKLVRRLPDNNGGQPPRIFQEEVTFANSVTFNGHAQFNATMLHRNADFAEYLLLADPNERIVPCEVVECFGGVISKEVKRSTWLYSTHGT